MEARVTGKIKDGRHYRKYICNNEQLGLYRLHDSDEIPTATPEFLGSCNTLRLMCILSDARVTSKSKMAEHVFQLLRELHWLRVPQRIVFRGAVVLWVAHSLSDPLGHGL